MVISPDVIDPDVARESDVISPDVTNCVEMGLVETESVVTEYAVVLPDVNEFVVISLDVTPTIPETSASESDLL